MHFHLNFRNLLHPTLSFHILLFSVILVVHLPGSDHSLELEKTQSENTENKVESEATTFPTDITTAAIEEPASTMIENQVAEEDAVTVISELVEDSMPVTDATTFSIKDMAISSVCAKCEIRNKTGVDKLPLVSKVKSEANSKQPLPPKNHSQTALASRLLLDSQHFEHISNDVGHDSHENEVTGNWTLLDELDDWEAPEFLRKSFPYYLSGYDEEDRPIWIAEYGKYDIRKVVEEGGTNVSLLEEYSKQAAYRILKSIRDRNRDVEAGGDETMGEVSEAWYILDMDGITIAQLTHPPTLLFKLKIVRAFRDIFVEHLAGVVVINANYVAHSLINFFRPVFGRVMEKVEIYGTQPSKWIPHLRRMFPPQSIPDWYGGNPNFTPVQVYG